MTLDSGTGKSWQMSVVDKNILVGYQRNSRIIHIQPTGYLAVGDYVHFSDPRRVHLQRSEGIPQLVLVVESGRCAVGAAHRYVSLEIGEEVGIRAVDPSVDDVYGNVLAELPLK